MTLKIDIEELNKELAERQIECLSPEYTRSSDKYEWLCLKCGHRWKTTHNSVVTNGRGCEKCGWIEFGKKQRLKITIEEINEKLKDRNIICLSEKYTKSSDHYLWKCSFCGEEWTTTYDSIFGKRKRGCPYCAIRINADKKRFKLSIEEINLKLENRYIICLSDKYLGVEHIHTWKCKICNSVWKTAYQNVVIYKRGCRRCSIENHSGENHHNWKGGFSLKDYSSEWNESKKESIRNRDFRKCQYPDCQYDDTRENKKLDVHHIDGNKKNCEDYNLISLCHKHHMKIQWKYEEWQNYFYAITDSFEYA